MAPSPLEIPIHFHTLLEIFFASPLFLGIVNPFCGGRGSVDSVWNDTLDRYLDIFSGDGGEKGEY